MTAGERSGSASSAISFDMLAGIVGGRVASQECQIDRSVDSMCSVVFSGLGSSSSWRYLVDVINSQDETTKCARTSRVSVKRVLSVQGGKLDVEVSADDLEATCCSCQGKDLTARVTIIEEMTTPWGNRGGTGSASVTVRGAGLGLVAYTSMVRSGATGCEGTEWESETSSLWCY